MKKRLQALVVLLVGVAAMLGLAISSASSASAATVGAQNFTIVQNDASATTSPVLATGVIHARGTDRTLSNTADVFRFRRGSLLVIHHKVAGTDTGLDRTTCLDRFTERGTYRIAAGSRLYRGATGRGVYNVNGLILFQKSPITGRCLTNATPNVFVSVVDATGTIRLPLV